MFIYKVQVDSEPEDCFRSAPVPKTSDSQFAWGSLEWFMPVRLCKEKSYAPPEPPFYFAFSSLCFLEKLV